METEKRGLFERIFHKENKEKAITKYFKMLNGYTPVFTSFEGGIYESELCRSAIHTFATHCAKLQPNIYGTAYKNLKNTLEFKPNEFMNTYQFLYRIATYLETQNTAFIVPIDDPQTGFITGYYPVMPQYCEVVECDNIVYLRYSFSSGKRAAVELERVGVLTKFQYKNDFFGETNKALEPTLNLIETQNQGIVEGIKNSATFRFMATLKSFTRRDDMKKARKELTEDNMDNENNGGIMLFGNQYDNVKQIDSQPFLINAAQQKLINESVYNYFGTNEKILRNDFNEDSWQSYFEGKIEPFSLQASMAMTNMTFSNREISLGNGIAFTANRLLYASNNTKLQVSTQLFDRGIFSRNDIMDIFNKPHVEDGDKHYIRKEYTDINKLDSAEVITDD